MSSASSSLTHIVSITFITLLITSHIQTTEGLIEFLFPSRQSNSSTSRIVAPVIQSRQVHLNPNSNGSYELPKNSLHQISYSPVAVFGEECETNGKQCQENKFLECIDGKCMCQNPMTRAFDEDLRKCVSLSGAHCGNLTPECVKNSQCNFGACQCNQGYIETSTKICLLNHRMPCRPRECNMDQGLACIKGSCQCIDGSMVYQPFSNKCVNPQAEFDQLARSVGRTVVSRVVSGTVSGATSLVFLPLRLLPVIG